MGSILFKIKKCEEYSGPHKWDNVLRCISNKMEIPNGQKKVPQRREVARKAA